MSAASTVQQTLSQQVWKNLATPGLEEPLSAKRYSHDTTQKTFSQIESAKCLSSVCPSHKHVVACIYLFFTCSLLYSSCEQQVTYGRLLQFYLGFYKLEFTKN